VRDRWHWRVAASALVLALGSSTAAVASSRTEAFESATHTVTIRLHVRYLPQPVATWKGTFISVSSSGQVVDRGTVLDAPRKRNGATWEILRKLVGKAGTERFRIVGPLATPAATLTWTILSGTGAYAGFVGNQGQDVEHFTVSEATARMSGVPNR
jgi:hypothetical protein